MAINGCIFEMHVTAAIKAPLYFCFSSITSSRFHQAHRLFPPQSSVPSALLLLCAFFEQHLRGFSVKLMLLLHLSRFTQICPNLQEKTSSSYQMSTSSFQGTNEPSWWRTSTIRGSTWRCWWWWTGRWWTTTAMKTSPPTFWLCLIW